MKRTPLKRTGGLNRGNKPLARSRLKQRSAKTAKRYKEERVPLVKRLLEERPWCEACPKFAEADGRVMFRIKPSVDLHEILTRGRTGGVHSDEWLDESNILCVCRPCHTRITRDLDGEATKLGLLRVDKPNQEE